jgi:16S rRNA (cytidine1402-2'-O)-methyltransferase
VLVAGAEGEPASTPVDLDEQIRAARAAGQGVRQLSEDIARRTGLPRREIYRRALALGPR